MNGQNSCFWGLRDSAPLIQHDAAQQRDLIGLQAPNNSLRTVESARDLPKAIPLFMIDDSQDERKLENIHKFHKSGKAASPKLISQHGAVAGDLSENGCSLCGFLAI